jgi:hypothetical protein
MRSFAKSFTIWNRRIHYYLGLYFLLFLWLFALTGFLLNHSAWNFQQFFPNRKIVKSERAIRSPGPGSDLEQAQAIMGQLDIVGEVQWAPPRTDPGRLEFSVNRPGKIWQIQSDLGAGHVNITQTQYNAWGILRTLHTFVGVSPTDSRNRRDWVLTTVWALSMDAVAAGIIVMVLGSFYMWWQLKDKRLPGLIVLALGSGVCLCFTAGLNWWVSL